jgi:hypothetical protein
MGECDAQSRKHRQVLLSQYRPKGDGEDNTHRKTPGQEKTVMLDGVRDSVDKIAYAKYCAANIDVGRLTTTGEGPSYGKADAQVEPFSTERKGDRVGTGARSITKTGSKRTDIYENPGGRDGVQLGVGEYLRLCGNIR